MRIDWKNVMSETMSDELKIDLDKLSSDSRTELERIDTAIQALGLPSYSSLAMSLSDHVGISERLIQSARDNDRIGKENDALTAKLLAAVRRNIGEGNLDLARAEIDSLHQTFINSSQ